MDYPSKEDVSDEYIQNSNITNELQSQTYYKTYARELKAYE